MRTQFFILLVFSFSALFIQGCNEGGGTTSMIKETSGTIPGGAALAKTIAYKPTINIVTGSKNDLNKTISSSLNHFTSLTVGVFEEQYAVVIKTDSKAANSKPTSYAPIAEQEFGDEIIEDEVVEETIQIESPIAAVDDELIVEKGPGASPFGDEEEDVLAAKGGIEAIAAPDSYASNFNINSIDAAYLLGKFNPATHDDFTKVNTKYASRGGMYVRKDVYEAFLKMYDAAMKDGIELKVLSATRSFSGQKRIWEAKWTGKRKVGGQDLSQAIPFGADRAKKILEYSAMPGTSRHHWGTDLDLCALNNAYFVSGKGKEIYDWLNANAHKFGFYQPYTERSDVRKTGHNEEKWHWSYLPVSKQLTQKYTRILSNDKVDGFLGQEAAADIGILENYVLGINSECK